ncbi:hypothetical protein [Actinoallomurus sp. NPDC052274]
MRQNIVQTAKVTLRKMAILAGWACSVCSTWNSDAASQCQGCGAGKQ